MATPHDIATAILSALTEIGVTGRLDVHMDGEAHGGPIGHPTGDDVAVVVTVTALDEAR